VGRLRVWRRERRWGGFDDDGGNEGGEGVRVRRERGWEGVKVGGFEGWEGMRVGRE